LKRLYVILCNLLLLGLPVLAWASGGGEKATQLQHKADLANLTGFNYLFAKWYNENIWLYALIVTVLMGVIGLLIALVTDVILKMVGMEVHKIEHHE
jgi:ABC-type phosphate/phosphonate transport system permease subunit